MHIGREDEGNRLIEDPQRHVPQYAAVDDAAATISIVYWVAFKKVSQYAMDLFVL